jgi:hypothetical protein
MPSRFLWGALGATAAVLVSCGAAPGASVATISVDKTKSFQTMTGWEAAIDLSDKETRQLFLASPDEVVSRAANELGINRLRLEIRAGAESRTRNFARFEAGELTAEQWRPLRYATENDNSDPKVIDWSGFDFTEIDAMVEEQLLPMRDAVAKRGERLHVNICYVAFTKQIKGGDYLHDDPEEYAEIVLATYLHLQKKYGFVPDTWEVILEPDLVPEWTPKFTAEAIAAAGRRLREHGFTPRFVAPSVTNTANAIRYIDAIARNKGAINDVVEFSYHRYRQATPSNVRAIAERAQRFGKSTSMLELWFGKATSKVLFEDLTVGNVSAFQGRTFLGHFQLRRHATGEVQISPRKDVRMNGALFVPVWMGARRIDAHSNERALVNPVAFVNTDGRMVVAALATGAVDLSFQGLAPGAYEARYGGETRSGVIAREIVVGADGRARATMPEAGVFSLAQKRAGPAK